MNRRKRVVVAIIAAGVVVVGVAGGVIWKVWSDRRAEAARKAEVDDMFKKMEESRQKHDRNLDQIIYGTTDPAEISATKERSRAQTEYDLCIGRLMDEVRKGDPQVSDEVLGRTLHDPDETGSTVAQRRCGDRPR